MGKLRAVLVLLLASLGVAPLVAQSQCVGQQLVGGTPVLLPTTTGSVEFYDPATAPSPSVPLTGGTVTPAGSGSWDPVAALADLTAKVRAATTAGHTRGDLILQPVVTHGTPVPGVAIHFSLPGEAATLACPAVGAGLGAGAGAVQPANYNDCLTALTADVNQPRGRYGKAILFNSSGNKCYSPIILGYGDLLDIGVVLKPNEVLPPNLSVNVTNCSAESPQPAVYSSGTLTGLVTTQAAPNAFQVVWLDQRVCASAAPTITLTYQSSGANPTQVTKTQELTLNQRYRATVHAGVLFTDLTSPTFALRTAGSQSVLYNSGDTGRGPQYVGAVVLQGVPWYFDEMFSAARAVVNNTDTSNWSYKGRDLINDNRWQDKVGLVIAAGLSTPGKRFGVGISYEIAYGLTLDYVYQFAQVSALDGYAVGDPFAGTASQIPTHNVWVHGGTLGLTFDVNYVTQLLGGSKK